MSDLDSFNLINQALREVYGNWIPFAFAYHALDAKSKARPGLLKPDDKPLAVEALLAALKEAHLKTDLRLLEWQPRTSGELLIEGDESRLAELVRRTIREQVRQIADSSDCEDRWFWPVERETPLYLESLGCLDTDAAVEELASNYFESWIEPSEDAVQRFADEIAALAVKKAFFAKYSAEEEGENDEE